MVPGCETRAIAASLSEQGVAIGLVLAFVVGGAGVSIPNQILLNKLFERRLAPEPNHR